MGKLIWAESPKSGLCDRLIDLMLMSTLAKAKDDFLYLRWREGEEIHFTKRQIDTWPAYRFTDYLLENVQRYFHFPENIVFVDDIDKHKGFRVNDYIGGIHSPRSFCK